MFACMLMFGLGLPACDVVHVRSCLCVWRSTTVPAKYVVCDDPNTEGSLSFRFACSSWRYIPMRFDIP